MKTYVIIDPFTNKPIKFSSFVNENDIVAKTSRDESGNLIVEKRNVTCVEAENSPDLLNKIYDPETKKFV